MNAPAPAPAPTVPTAELLIPADAELSPALIRDVLGTLEAEFKTEPAGTDRRAVAAARIRWIAAGLRIGMPPVTLERLSGVSRQSIYRIVPATAEVRWFPASKAA